MQCSQTEVDFIFYVSLGSEQDHSCLTCQSNQVLLNSTGPGCLLQRNSILGWRVVEEEGGESGVMRVMEEKERA